MKIDHKLNNQKKLILTNEKRERTVHKVTVCVPPCVFLVEQGLSVC